MDRNEKVRANHRKEHAAAGPGTTAREYFAEPERAVRRSELLWLLAWLEDMRRQRTWYRRLWRWAGGKGFQNLWPWEQLMILRAKQDRDAPLETRK